MEPISRKDIIKKGFSILKTYELNIEEIKLILSEIEKNSQVITKDILIDSKNKEEVFFDDGEMLKIKSDYLNELEKRNKNLNEFDTLFSVLSVKGNDGGHYQLVSIDKSNNIYLNFNFLKRITFNEYYYSFLHNLKYEQFNLPNILSLIFRGFLPYAQEYIKYQYAEVFEQYSIFKKLELLTMIFEDTNSHIGRLEDRVYVYYLNNKYDRLKNDLESLKEKIHSKENGNLLLLKENLPVKNKTFFKLKTEIPDSIESINKKTGFSYYQSIVFNNLNYTNEYVLGLAGSGKTHMASIIAKIFLLFKAVWFANKREVLPIQYISYSKESVQKSFLPKMGPFAVYFEKNNDLTISSFKKILSEVENPFSKKDMDRLIELDSIFKNKKDILEAIEKTIENDRKYTNEFNQLLKEEEIKALLKVIKTMGRTKERFSKIKMILYKLIKKREEDALKFSKKITQHLKRIVDIKELEKVEYMEIENLLFKYKKLYSDRVKRHYQSANHLINEEPDYEQIEINVDNIDTDNILFYVKNMWRLLPEKELNNIKKTIQKFIYKNNDRIDSSDYKNINKIVPVIAMPADEIFNIPINQKAFLTLIDESLLINQFLYYSIFARTIITYSFGDINQLNLNFLYNKSTLFEKIKKLYADRQITDQDIILKKNIFLNEKYNVASIWDAVFKMSPNVNILIDNFRNIKHLVYTLIRTNPTYISYIKKLVSKNRDVLKEEIVSQIENAETIDDMIKIVNIYNNEIIKFRNFKGEEIDVPLIIFNTQDIDNRVELFDYFFEFIKMQDFKIDNILIVSIFKQDVTQIKRDMDFAKEKHPDFNIHIDILSADKIQALEYDLVVLLLEDSNSRNYLVENDKLLNVIISRAKKGFITICDMDTCSNHIISNIFAENNFQIIKPEKKYYN